MILRGTSFHSTYIYLEMETSRALIGHKHYTSNNRIKEVVWYGVKQLFHVLKGEGESQYWEFKFESKISNIILSLKNAGN